MFYQVLNSYFLLCKAELTSYLAFFFSSCFSEQMDPDNVGYKTSSFVVNMLNLASSLDLQVESQN